MTSGRSAEIESFHAFDSRMDASRPGLLLFTARYGDRDALFVWDLERRKATGRYQFPELVSLLSPHWMPDGRSIVVSGLSERGVSDLYRVSLPGGELEPLTNDHYQDLDPSPSPDGRHLVFASDRTAEGRGGAANLFLLDLASGATTQLTSGDWRDESPLWARGRPDLFHLRPGRRAQRLLRRFRRRGAPRDVRLDRRVRRRAAARGRAHRGRIPRPELEPLPDPGRLLGAPGALRAGA